MTRNAGKQEKEPPPPMLDRDNDNLGNDEREEREGEEIPDEEEYIPPGS